MTTEQWIKDLTDDIVMEHGVSYDTARVMLFTWLSEVVRWTPKFHKMLEYLLNE